MFEVPFGVLCEVTCEVLCEVPCVARCGALCEVPCYALEACMCVYIRRHVRMCECMYDFDGFCDDAEKGDFCFLAKSCLKSLVEFFASSLVEFLV